MRILFTAYLLWIVSTSLVTKGQSDCPRTNRQASRRCAASCNPASGCDRPGDKCLCDGDCGYSCVQEALSCGRPPSVPKATAQYQSITFGAVATYVCNSGYTLSGASQRTCRATGRWDAVGPKCLPMCSVPEIPFSTYIKSPVDYNRTYKTGDRITLACKKGFELQGENNNPIRICISGRWTQFPFKCQGTHSCRRTIRPARTKCTQECSPESGCGSESYLCLCDGNCGYSCVEKDMSCGNPPAISNGKLNFTGTSYNNTAHYKCDDGFSLNTVAVKRCTAKKRWSGLTPRCLRDCSNPKIPKNAIILNPSDNYPSGYKVIFKCNEGYNQEGMATQMCFQGQWTVLPFKCSEGGCGDPGTPYNGRKVGVIYSVNRVVYFDCDFGYELVGSEKRKCQSNGTWTGQQPVCEVVDCGFPAKPKNGRYIGNETTFQSSLRFECDEGYDLVGFKERMCTSDKKWSGKDVICAAVDCGKLLKPMNSSMLGKETTFPNQVQFSCDEGFTLRGSQRRTCQANRTWSGNEAFCDAVDCGAFSSPMNGSSEGKDTTFPNTITFKCDVGFDLIGSRSRKCMADKRWSGVMPVCKAVDCGKLPSPTNGSLIGEATNFPNQVEIRCDKGFILRGSHLRICLADRTWSGDSTFCEAINCGKPRLPEHGSVSGGSTRYPHSITFTCGNGFEIEGSVVRKCQANGTWSGTEAICKPVDCGPLISPLNGSAIGEKTTFLSSVTVRCDDGFNLMGSTSRTCQANKQWSGHETLCSAKDCGFIGIPRNGTKRGSQTTYPGIVIFSCDDGFIMRGSAERQCSANGSWSGVETNCEAVDCGPLPVLLNGSYKGDLTVYPNKVVSYCDEGFLLKGSVERFCQANRTWSGKQAICEAVDCGTLSAPLNGSVQGSVTTFPNVLQLGCDRGFTLEGSNVRKCQANATWSGRTTFCKAKDCGHLPVPMNGSINGKKTDYPNQLLFLCDEGFDLIGSIVRRCQDDGRWSGEQPTCKAKGCGSLSIPNNGTLFGRQTTFPNEVSFRCDEGFLMMGSEKRQCQADGTWSGNATSCSAVDCGRLLAPKNGSVRGDLTVFPESIKFSCDEGFIMSGSSVRYCQANGTWSGNETVCNAVDCGALSALVNGTVYGEASTYPSILLFECDEGFTLYGSDSRACQSNGAWSGNDTICQANDCGPLAMPRNGSSVGGKTTYPNEIMFSCDEGFILIGSTVRQCQANKTWGGLATYCEAIDCGYLPVPRNGSIIGGETKFPNLLRFECDEGFTLVGSHEKKCLANGTWSGTNTFCEANDCGPLSIPMNGTLLGNVTTYPNKISFSCDEGFILQGSAVRQCQPNKRWTGNDTFCHAVDCGAIDSPTSGSLSGNQTLYPNSVHFACDPGFILSGSSLRTCQANGTWDGTNTICSAIDCGIVKTPQNGSVLGEVTTYPNVLRFYCDEGFTLHGADIITCQASGSWSGTAPICKANDCGPLPVPMNGTLIGNLTTYPNKVNFTCDEGFVLQGSAIRQCLPDKRWAGNDTFCKAKDCGPLAVPTNGSFLGSQTSFPNRFIFSCDEGFILKGSKDRKCQSNGTWSGSESLCAAKDCGALIPPKNGSLFGHVTTYPHNVKFSCDEGFNLRGSNFRQCLSTGNWSGSSAFCEAEDCGPLLSPTNGSSVGEKTTYPNTKTFNCRDGFILRGSKIRECRPNGMWSGVETFCEARSCGLLLVPANGSSIGNHFTYPNKISFMCDKGFTLKGSELRQCQANGEWTGNDTFCEAVNCGPLSTPLNGSLSDLLTVYPNQVQFDCDPGFVLRGSSVRTCQSNGTWDGYDTVCEAVDCGELYLPQNGTMIGGEKTTYPSIVHFSCDEGFILNGSTLRKCQTNGTWSGNTTKCQAVECGPLPVPINGSSSGDSTVFPNSVQFSCDPGFILNGSSKRTCLANGIWSGLSTLCVAVDCGQPPSLRNGSITGKSTTYPNFMHLSCDEGFVLNGSSKIQCHANRTWSKSSSFCSAKDCGLLAVPLNGSVSGTETTFPNEAMFNCDEGFLLKGSTVRRCQADGSWSGTQASCKAVDCGPLKVPLNGSSSGGSTVFPNSVLFDCDSGFILNGSSSRKCQANRTWSGSTAECIARDCGPLPVPRHGSSFGDQTVFPNKIRFSCDEGFNVIGSDVRRCQENGTWGGIETFCEAVDCGSLSAPMNGSSSGDLTVFPNSVLFNCDAGFIIGGSTKRKCQANGTWSGSQTVCNAQDCGPLPVPKNGSFIGDLTVFSNKFLFDCDQGFNLRGSSVRHCQENGTWSGNPAYCEAVDCGSLPVPMNGSYSGDFTVYPNSVLFNCDPGFVLSGSPQRTCQANATWSGLSTSCVAKDCGQLPVPLNGSHFGRETTFPNEAMFSCDEGFNLNGSSVRRCLSNGSWSGTETFCKAVDCGPLSAVMNGSSFGDSTVFPNSILFTCDPGFILNGSSSRTCQANGTWSGMPVACNARNCGPLPVLRNGSSTGNLTTFPNKIVFGCDKGFNVMGSGVRFCQENGTWSGNPTFCKAVDCGHLPAPTNGTSAGGSTVFPNRVLFKCDSGFILSGSSKRTCQANATWSGFQPVCNAVDCGPLPVPMNGSFSGDSTVFPNSGLFKCDPGFILHGSVSRTCQANGTWSGSSTACVAVDCGPPQPFQDGSITGRRTVYPNVMHLNCDEGFILRGSSEIQCQTNGTWSKTASFCKAIDCGPLSLPSNGSYTARSTTFPNEATFSCDEGFILKGSAVRICQANGSWSGTDTSCKAVDCGPLSVPRNGALSGSLTVFSNSAQLSCYSGYILSGSSSRMCLANGTWSGIQPVCTPVDCGLPQPLHNGSLSGNSTVFPGTMRLACDAGFILRGEPVVRCQANGTWSRPGSFCEARNCGQLSKPLNGTIIGSKTTYPSEVEFKCDDGFDLQGSAIRKCEANGQWSGAIVKCQAVDCGPITVPEYAVSHGSTTAYPGVITFSCKPGFFLHGESTRRCQADGTWTTGDIQCKGMDCGLLKPPENGWMFGSKTTHPHNVSFTCRRGYRLVGPSQRTCLRNGSWSGHQPICVAHWCSKAPEVPVFAYQTWRAAKLRYEHGENIYYSCKPGFIMVGIPKRQCIMGEWSPIKFRCSAPSCNGPVIPKLSYVTSSRGSQSRYLDGEKVYYSCHTGYELVGIPEVECQDGVWTTPRFSCEPVSCGTLPTPLNGVIQRNTGTTYTAVYVFRCKEAQGYLMRGSAWRRCLANATWSGVQPVCYMQTCNAPRHPRYGKVIPKLSKYLFGNSVQYQCNSGFSVRGHKTTTCQIYGNWTNPVPTCVSCSSPFGLQNRMIFNHKLTASSERDSRHGAKHGRLHGDSAWCSARSSMHKYFQIDFGRMVEVTAVATQGHPKEHKWMLKYVLKYSLGNHWLTYQESGQEKVFQGNRDRNTVVKHYLKEQLVAKRVRIFRYQDSRDFIGSTACLRAEVYGCYFESECLAIGSEVFARWNSINKHTRYFHGFITKIHQTSVEVTPSGNHGARVNSIMELPRAEKRYVILDRQSKPAEIRTGAEVIVASDDRIGFSQGKVTQTFSTWYGVELGNGKKVWSKARDIRLLKGPIYCDRE